MFGGDPFGGGDPFDDPFFTGGGSSSREGGRRRDPFGGGLLGQMMGGGGLLGGGFGEDFGRGGGGNSSFTMMSSSTTVSADGRSRSTMSAHDSGMPFWSSGLISAVKLGAGPATQRSQPSAGSTFESRRGLGVEGPPARAVFEMTAPPAGD